MAHLLEKFRFCPACGSSDFDVNDFKSKRCRSCGFTYYMNAATAVAVLIEGGDGNVLVCRRAFEPAAGTLDLVGGFVDPGESLEQAVLREVMEEAGIRLDPASLRLVGSFPNEYVYSGLTIHTCDAIFAAPMPSGQHPAPSDDASELILVPSAELESRIAEFGFASIRAALLKYCCEIR